MAKWIPEMTSITRAMGANPTVISNWFNLLNKIMDTCHLLCFFLNLACQCFKGFCGWLLHTVNFKFLKGTYVQIFPGFVHTFGSFGHIFGLSFLGLNGSKILATF